MKLESKIESAILVNGESLAEYVDKEHTKEIRQHRTEELNHFNKIKKKSTKCHVMNTSKDAKTTTRIFQKYEIRREEFMMNKEEMKDYDQKHKGSVKTYLIYAAYEWKEICKEMYGMKLFISEEHEKFNLASLEIFLQHRYGSLEKSNGIANFGQRTTSSIMTTIYDKLVEFGLVRKYRETKSVTNGLYYEFNDLFYTMPIQQVMELVFGKKKAPLVKDPNLLCFDMVKLNHKIQSYQNKPYQKDFAPTRVVEKLKRITKKAPAPEPKDIGNCREGADKTGFSPDADLGLKILEVHGGDNAEDIIENIRRKQENIVKSTTAFLESEKNNFEEIVRILNKNGILMKESVIYPNGVIKITYI